MEARSEPIIAYGEREPADTQLHDLVIVRALEILRSRLAEPGRVLASPKDTREYLWLRLAGCEHELFCLLHLDSRHRVLGFERLFRGTLDGASVHPREVVKAALARNAAAVILAHNHPSGDSEPSAADRALTKRLVDALGLVDIRVLDHVVVGSGDTVSFAERGLI